MRYTASIERRTTGIPAIVVGEKRFAYKHVEQLFVRTRREKKDENVEEKEGD